MSEDLERHTPPSQEVVTPEQLESARQIQNAKPQLRLGALLLQEDFITHKHLNLALQQQAQGNKLPLGQILAEMGAVTEEIIKWVLSKKFVVPGLNLSEFQVDPDVIRAIPAALVRKQKVVPLYFTESYMVVAMEDPLAAESVRALELCTLLKIEPVMGSQEDVEFLIRQFYGVAIEEGRDISQLLSELPVGQESVKSADGDEVAISDDVVVGLVNKIILDAFERGASEIHVESAGGSKPSRVRFRKNGAMVPYTEIPADFRTTLISRIKTIGGLDIAEKRHSQDGSAMLEQLGPVKLELRVVTIPTADGLEDVFMRILTTPEAISLHELGMAPYVLGQLHHLVVKPQGILYVCGPTGSGKTTTLHSLLGYINTPERKIWTAEDPIEITQEGLRQVQVNTKIGWTFAAALRSFLSAGPDVVMIGETRDSETAKTVIEASVTGHLVLSTLHTNGAAESIVRLLNFGVEPFSLADALLGVLGQRLARRLCVACREPHILSTAQMEILARQYCYNSGLNSVDVLKHWQTHVGDEDGRLMIFSAVGCSECSDTGYKGHVGMYELLLPTTTVRKKIQSRADANEIFRIAISEGMQTMKQDGIEKVLQGHTDLVQVQAVCP